MTNNNQSPAQEMAQRSAESIPALQAAAAAVGLQDHQRMLRDHARRVRDSHHLGMKAAGLDHPDSDQASEDMGHIIISGDITNTYLPPAAPQPPMTTNTTSGLSNLTKAALIAMSLASGSLGAAIPLVANALLNRPTPPPVVQPANPNGYEIRLVPEK